MASSSQVRRSRREQLEAQRLEAAKKERRNRIVFVGIGMLVLVGVIGVAIWGFVNSASTASGTTVPPNANSGRNGIYLAPPTNDALVLEEFVDYNCSACKSANLTLSAAMDAAAENGEITVIIHPLSFEAATSRDAAIAASCADTVGYFKDYHKQLFINQATGFDATTLLTTIPNAVGMTSADLNSFQTCFNNQATGNFVTGVQTYATKQNVGSTPTFLLNGENVGAQLWNAQTRTYDPDLLRKLIESQ